MHPAQFPRLGRTNPGLEARPWMPRLERHAMPKPKYPATFSAGALYAGAAREGAA
jgi:hypothetical protein